jgi:hypothetical protein
MDLSCEGVLVLEFPKMKRIQKIVGQHKLKDDSGKDFFSILFSLNRWWCCRKDFVFYLKLF